MAAVPFHSCWGVPELRLFYSLLTFWSAFVGNGSAVAVTQEPTFAKGLPGTGVSFRCSVDAAGHRFYWYHQVPGKTELEVLGYFPNLVDELDDSPQKWKNRLKAKWEDQVKKKMRLDLTGLQPGDTGFYLCAAVRNGDYTDQAYFAQTTTQLLVLDSECEKEQLSPSVVLLSPVCHKKRITLVCLAQDFPYKWPLNVTWKCDGHEIPHRLSFATEPVQEQRKCHFATASRLSILEEEWQEGHNYSCHINQSLLVEESSWVKSKSGQKGASGVSEVQLSLYAGHFIFLLLGAKSLAYSAVLGIYAAYRKRGR